MLFRGLVRVGAGIVLRPRAAARARLFATVPNESQKGRGEPSAAAAPAPHAAQHRFLENLPRPEAKFHLDPDFVRGFEKKKAPFGFNGLGEFVFLRTYSRKKADGSRERWHETVARVVNGAFNMKKRWVLGSEGTAKSWDEAEAQELAKEMFSRIYDMKFLPPGRGLWAMGTALTEERERFAALNNCAFVSTANLAKDLEEPFCFLMDSSMLGVGVGFDTEGAGAVIVKAPSAAGAGESFVVPDSREGWVQSLRLILRGYFRGDAIPDFDFRAVRRAGEPIHGFGGIAQGPEPLQKLHEDVRGVLDPLVGSPLSVRAIVDVMNLIGVCIVAGNVRRTAEIAFGSAADEEYIALKDYSVNPDRAAHGWTSNNSVFAELGMDYHAKGICDRVQDNGEPGFAWLENMRKYDRMCDPPTWKDEKASGGNPCLEQTLESFEMCCLVETFPCQHLDLDDYRATLECAFLYAKCVTLGGSHWTETSAVMGRNRRIGTSMSGIAQFTAAKGVDELRRWCDEGYTHLKTFDEKISKKLDVPESIKITSVKPSGTVSLLAGATPGVHFPEAEYYLRRVRLAADSELLPSLRSAGYRVEEAVGDSSAVVVEFPVHAGDGVRTVHDVTMWEQLSIAALLQRWWSDNQVSCTVSCSDDFTLFLWSPTDSKKPLSRMTGHQQAVAHIAFSPDGRYVASASFDKKVKIWNGRTGAFVATLTGHVASVYQVVWSADSRLLVSGSKDSTLKLWELKSLKKARNTLPGHADEVYALDWSPNGSMVASGSKDRTIKIFRN